MLFSTTSYYSKQFVDNDSIYFVEPFNILKYQTGQEYKAHFDGGTYTRRSISSILYLNDEYTGGELEFVNYNIKIKPSPGMLVLFPSNYAYSHIAHPVKTGTKYAIVTWLHDQPKQ
jgi:predicted 2-oxoglutarate/Fe(II)-dependent dioxygenase YbiX